METMGKIVNTIVTNAWLVLGIVCALAVLFAGAYWHGWTALLCYLMWRVSREQNAEDSSAGTDGKERQ